MAGRIYTRGRGRLGSRRETSWLAIDPGVDTVSATAILAGSLNAAALAKRPFTVIRTILEVHIGSDQLAADELQLAAVGMAVVSDQAVAIGVTAVPTPVTDLASDLWFLHQTLISSFFFVNASGIDADGGHHYSIDSRAARKVNDDQDVILVVEGAAIASGASVTSMGRMLIKES